MPAIDPAIDDIVARMLARDPNDRFPSARAVARALAPHVGDRKLVERRIASTPVGEVPRPSWASLGAGMLLTDLQRAATSDVRPTMVAMLGAAMLLLTIAVVKASLVCLFFMHLRWSRPFNSFMFIASVTFAMLFIGFSITDTREALPAVDKGDAKIVVEVIGTLPAETAAAEVAPVVAPTTGE